MYNKEIKISVIMPMYNVEEYISRSIESLIEQTLDDVEIILIDDNSTDETFNIASKYAQAHSNIKIFKQPSNLGSGAARNYGKEIARGQYIFFMDDDDFIEKDSLMIMYNAAIENDSDLVTGKHKLYIEELDRYIDGDMFNTYPTLSQAGFKQIHNNPELFYLIYCWGKLYKRDLIEGISFSNLSNAQDMPFTVYAYLNAKKIYSVDATIYNYRRRGKNSYSITQKISTNPDRYVKNFFEVLNIVTEYFIDNKNNIDDKTRHSLFIYFINRVISRDICGVLFSTLKATNDDHKVKVFQEINEWILSINGSVLLDASSFQVMIKEINSYVSTFSNEMTNCYLELLKNAKSKMLEATSTSNVKAHDHNELKKRKKVVFFSKGDDKFLQDILVCFSEEYEVKKITVSNTKQIEEGMNWADICWFEWCDELIIHGSNLPFANKKKIICRLHSYEAFTPYIKKVNWEAIDKVIFVADYIRDFVLESEPKLREEKTVVIPNGVNLKKYSYKERSAGFKIAYVGYLNFKKGPMLLLHAFKQIVDYDKRYTLHIAGDFQEVRYVLYYSQMIREMKLEKHVFFDGWQENMNTWLEDKSYILTSSVLESQHMAVMEAMAMGIKPLVHNFVGAKFIYKDEHIWTTLDNLRELLQSKYNSADYHSYINSNYSLEKQLDSLKNLFVILMDSDVKNTSPTFDYARYWNNRLDNRFNIEGVGYNGLGEVYNKYLYKARFEILDNVLKELPKNDFEILEIGPGIGMFTDYFKGLNPSYYKGIDITSKSVKFLSEKYPEFDFVQGDISDELIYSDRKKYDLIFGADVLLHLTDEEKYIKSMKNFKKSLKNNGVMVFFDPISLIGTKSQTPHVIIRDYKYIQQILDQEGLEIKSLIPSTFLMNNPFDAKILPKDKSEIAVAIFNFLSGYFTKEKNIANQEAIAKYLYTLDKLCLLSNEFGLSQKCLVIGKKGENDNIKLNINKVWLEEEFIEEYENLSVFYEKSFFEENPKLAEVFQIIKSKFIQNKN